MDDLLLLLELSLTGAFNVSTAPHATAALSALHLLPSPSPACSKAKLFGLRAGAEPPVPGLMSAGIRCSTYPVELRAPSPPLFVFASAGLSPSIDDHSAAVAPIIYFNGRAIVLYSLLTATMVFNYRICEPMDLKFMSLSWNCHSFDRYLSVGILNTLFQAVSA